jgi:hypothetical protein
VLTLFQRRIFLSLLIATIALLCSGTLSLAAQHKLYNMYRDLPELLRQSNLPSEFIPLSDFEAGNEMAIQDASIEYLNAHPELVERIRSDLGAEEIQWRLQKLSHRIVYAPEDRPDVARLFLDYCQEAIADLLDLTGLENPYCSISAITAPNPDMASRQGIIALIVQDLAHEYTARYQFSGTGGKRIEIDFSGRIKVNEVGSYSSYLQYSEKAHGWEFIHNRHTVWKSASTNPYTVLMTPLEETLHIMLREFTEKAILQSIKARPDNPTLPEIQSTVEDWLALEEAIVGGLVYKIVPDVVISRVPTLSLEWIQADLKTKSRYEKYRLLPKAIQFVEINGLKECIRLYGQDPMEFRRLLTEQG